MIQITAKTYPINATIIFTHKGIVVGHETIEYGIETLDIEGYSHSQIATCINDNLKLIKEEIIELVTPLVDEYDEEYDKDDLNNVLERIKGLISVIIKQEIGSSPAKK